MLSLGTTENGHHIWWPEQKDLSIVGGSYSLAYGVMRNQIKEKNKIKKIKTGSNA